MLPILIMNTILVVIAIFLILAEKFLVTYGECKISLNKKRILNVIGGDTLLNYFTGHKIFIPSACSGKATCGYCKIEVLSGAGHTLPTEEVFIPRNDRLRGIRLACQVKVKNNIEVLIPEDLLEAREFKATVLRIEDLTYDIKYILLRLDEPGAIQFKPGQYVQVKIPSTDECRAYSIASLPSQNNSIELIVRRISGGLCSTYIHEVLDTGDQVTFTGPFGEFYLREDPQRNVICIGGGCGMAAIRSIIKHLAQQNMPRQVMYFFGARSRRDLFFTEELFALSRQFPNFKYVPALSEPKSQDNWDGETGLITQVVEKIMPQGADNEAYLCGPSPMIDAAIEVLTQKGVKEAHIYYDKF